MAKKEPIYRGLAELTVQIEDASIASPNYFKIVNLPTEFTAGKNIFKFRGNPSLFNENSIVYTEILDSNNKPIYHEVELDEESDPKSAVVVVYINQDTAPGPAKIILCTTAYKDINNNALDTSKINVRWTGAVYIDISKINPAEIVFSKLPTINITNSTGSYVNYGYALGERVVSQSVTGLQYVFSGKTPVLITGSNCTIGFTTSSLYASVDIPFISGSNYYPSIPGTVATLFPSQSTQIYKSNIVGFNGKGIAYLQTPMTFELVNNNTLYRPSSVNIITASINYTQQNSSAVATQNTYNYATVFFSDLAPQVGAVAKIRSYYKSSGVGEYIFSNETNILDQSSELGFTVDVVTASFALPTVQRNDRIDFKFEFVNPIGLVSKQYVESLNNLYLGGNTYIGGNDNLLTGSLFVAGATGTGVEITGKGSSAMVRSIGYQGFQNAITNNGGQYSGFVIYSGSVQAILGSAESYSGVGLELVANSSSYFKYASANGGLLDIRTNEFFLGSSTSYIASLNQSMSIYSSNFSLNTKGQVTASAILVTKTPTAGTSQIMIDTTNGILDATNLGRIVYSSNVEEVYGPSNATIPVPAVAYSSSLHEFYFQGLKNEYRYTVSCMSQVTVINDANSNVQSSLRFRLYAATIRTGSYTISSNYAYNNWTLVDSVSATGLTSTVTDTSATTTYYNTVHAEDYLFNTRTINVSVAVGGVYEGRLFKGVIDFRHANTGSPGATITEQYKAITVTATRGLSTAGYTGFANPVNLSPPTG